MSNTISGLEHRAAAFVRLRPQKTGKAGGCEDKGPTEERKEGGRKEGEAGSGLRNDERRKQEALLSERFNASL